VKYIVNLGRVKVIIAKDSASILLRLVSQLPQTLQSWRDHPEGWGLLAVSTTRRNSRRPAVSEIRPSQSYELKTIRVSVHLFCACQWDNFIKN